MRHGDVVKWRLAGLGFADYLVLMADNLSDMKVLLTTCEARTAMHMHVVHVHCSKTQWSPLYCCKIGCRVFCQLC